MFVVREVMHCKPGKVGAMVKKFKGVGEVMEKMGFAPFRLMTDVSGERFWTVIAETEVESLGALLEMEERVMSEQAARDAMAGYHDLVDDGRREIYKLES